MIVWGGRGGRCLNTGGRYCAAGTERDTHANPFSDPNSHSNGNSYANRDGDTWTAPRP
jgi:hypothetical protein